MNAHATGDENANAPCKAHPNGIEKSRSKPVATGFPPGPLAAHKKNRAMPPGFLSEKDHDQLRSMIASIRAWPDRWMAIPPLSGALYGSRVNFPSDLRAYDTQIASPGGGLAMHGAFGLIPCGKKNGGPRRTRTRCTHPRKYG